MGFEQLESSEHSDSQQREIVGALNHLTLWGRISLPSYIRLQLKQRLSRTEHRSS
jgi:hypothetical protein